MSKTTTTDLKLRERVKELRCLYAVTRFALEAGNDVDALLRKTLQLLPDAMQFPALAEVSIVTRTTSLETAGFAKCRNYISSTLELAGGPDVGPKHSGTFGSIRVGYRPATANGRGVNAKKTVLTLKGTKQISGKSMAAGKAKVAAAKKNSTPAFLNEEKSLLKAIARELSLFINKVHIAESNKKLELQLQHSERLAFVGELSAGIAHELNEPLGRILGFAQLIQKNGALTGQPAEDIERIIKASLYTREIIKKLMLFSRQMPRQVIPVELNAIIANILYFIDVRFQDRNVVVIRKLDPNLPDLQADPVQLSQVLVNLITNAIHAMPEGGQITVTTKSVTTKTKNDTVSLSVADTGHGMTPAVRKKIFEPFFTTKPVGQGTGLGLSVVQGIVEEHRGWIAVTSAVGKGSKFDVRLPIQIDI